MIIQNKLIDNWIWIRKSHDIGKWKNGKDKKNHVILQVSQFEVENRKISQDFFKDWIKIAKQNTFF